MVINIKHPKNKRERISYQKSRVNKIKKEISSGYWRENYWPIYAKNRGQNWKTAPIQADAFNGQDWNDYCSFSGRFQNEPVYLKQKSKNGYKKFFKHFAIRQARRNRRYKLKGSSYKKVYDLWNWD